MATNSQHYIGERKRTSVREIKNNSTSRSFFQLLMRIFVNEKMARVIETDNIISKGNYWSRKRYSIDDLMLEKRL